MDLNGIVRLYKNSATMEYNEIRDEIAVSIYFIVRTINKVVTLKNLTIMFS